MSEEKSYFALWAQVNPAEGYEFLTCVGLTGNVVIPKGDLTIVYCPAVESGAYVPDMLITGEAGLVTFSIEQPLEHVFNWTLELLCPINLRLNYVCGGDRNVFDAYRVGVTMIYAKSSTGSIVDPTALQPADNERVMTSADFSALHGALVKKLTGTQQGVTATTGVNDIDFLPPMCLTDCSIYVGLGDYGYAVLDTDYLGAYGDTVLRTVNGGGTWATTTTSPFLTLGRNATAVKVKWTGSGTHRVIVAGGAMAATHPEISYSDDAGVTWYNVNPRLIGGQGINQMCWDALGRLWAVADGGYIYVSSTQGASWSTAEAGVEVPGVSLNDIVFYNGNVGYAVGNTNAVLQTLDGANWDTLTGPIGGTNNLTVAVNRYGHVFIGDNAARIWRSIDQGANWVEMIDYGGGSINRLRADPQYRYFLSHIYDDALAAGTLYRSEDGGASFVAQVTPANVGLDALCVVDPNVIYIGGEVVALTSFIAKFIRRV